MKIIQFMNPKTKKIEKYVEISSEEKSAFRTVMDVLGELQKVASDNRDVFELKYARKFLCMISSLENVESITSGIDEILVDDELVGNIIDQEDFEEDIDIKEIVDEVRNIIDSFIDQGMDLGKKNSANSKKKKPKEKQKDKYEQLKIDIDMDEEEGKESK